MSEDAILERLTPLVRHVLCDETLSLGRDTKLEDHLNADSIDRIELLIDVEDAFEIDLLDDACFSWTTLGDVADAIEAAVTAKSIAMAAAGAA